MDLDFYSTPGPLTALTADQAALVSRLDPDPLELCRAAQRLVVSPPDAALAGLSKDRMAEINVRPASALLTTVLELDNSPLDQERPPDRRVVGTCRHFAVMATALLRAAGLPARARCGFATYFIPPRKVDHWIVEHWSSADQRWVRIDPEWVDRTTPGSARTEDLRPGEFLTAGEAWELVRSAQADPALFGVFGTENWGPGEVRGNAMRDLASVLHKIEMLPWDEWGPMKASYDGTTGEDFDVLMDELAIACADDDGPHMQRVYDELAVPPSMVC